MVNPLARGVDSFTKLGSKVCREDGRTKPRIVKDAKYANRIIPFARMNNH